MKSCFIINCKSKSKSLQIILCYFCDFYTLISIIFGLFNIDLSVFNSMKQILFLIFIIGFASKSFGQFDSNIKFKPIPPKKNTAKPKKETLPPPSNFQKLNLPKIIAPNVFKETNIFGIKPKPNNSFQIGNPENQISMTVKNKFEHKLGDVFQNKMTKDLSKTLVREGLKEDDRYLVKIDLNFGVIRTKSKYFIIKYRDFGAIDGDLVKSVFNDYVVADNIFLEFDFNEFRIHFKEGINNLSIVALNRGTLGGNTGEFQIYDAEGKYILSDYWQNLDTGVQANFIIIKE